MFSDTPCLDEMENFINNFPPEVTPTSPTDEIDNLPVGDSPASLEGSPEVTITIPMSNPVTESGKITQVVVHPADVDDNIDTVQIIITPVGESPTNLNPSGYTPGTITIPEEPEVTEITIIITPVDTEKPVVFELEVFACLHPYG